ncbi:RNA-binding domain-containing protein [uncultured Sphaerochaeta sp.]|uniref:ATP-binding protein n=1 Tax=uncultured Sphaerochaeta sp. TaxID=886478 RepID=UPI002A0A5A6B|nr:RNA-binding domain-containing protein [uncultured Sphaerochaeta sp.]
MDKQLTDLLVCFLKEFIKQFEPEKILLFKKSYFMLFRVYPEIRLDFIEYPAEIPDKKKYNLIIGDLPFGMPKREYPKGLLKKSYRENFIDIIELSSKLEKEGIAIITAEPSGYSTNDGKAFEKELNSHGFFINAYIRAPEGILDPYTKVTPILAIISRNNTGKLFLAEILEIDQIQEIVQNYKSKKNGLEITSGKFVEKESFWGFGNLHILPQIERLKLQFSEFEEYQLSDLAESIKTIQSGAKFEDFGNAIYVPRIGNSSVVRKIEEFKLKHHNYFQIVLKNSVSNEYLTLFFQTTLGRLILNSLFSESYINHLTKARLEKSMVVLPPLNIQDQIIKANRKLNKLKISVDSITSEMAINPLGTDLLLKRIDKLADALDLLSDADRVRSKIREGESKNIEFKETLSIDVAKETKEKYIETSSLKTIVAFLNTDGGTLLIGVSDYGEIRGLDHEIDTFHKNKDKFLLHWKNLLKERIGQNYYTYINWQIVVIDDKMVLEVICKASDIACYLDNNEFYVRTNPATDKLEGPRLVEYVNQRFSKH